VDSDKIISFFAENPDGFLDFLIAKRKLKGGIRALISRFILDNSHAPQIAKYMWLPLLPHTLSVVSTKGRCNLACRMCGGGNGRLEYLRAADLDRMMAHTPTAELVILVAGDSEPLLNPETSNILRTIHAHHANCNIVTNGHLLSDRLIDAMVKTGQPASINVSLDAATPNTYKAIRGASLEAVTTRLARLRDAKNAANVQRPIISLLMVGMEDNIDELPRFIELAAELGANRVHVDHMHGNYSPGDFHLSRGWQDIMIDALIVSRETGVGLQLPHDTLRIMQDKLNSAMVQGRMHHPPSPPAAEKSQPETGPEPTTSMCPWLNSVFVTLSGEMRPCCDTASPIGNIMDSPLKENATYLGTRLGNLAGKTHRDCMRAANCAYVQELRRQHRAPEFMD